MKFLADSNSITAYWLYDKCRFGSTYDFYIDDRLIHSSLDSHFTFSNLESDKEYKITIKIGDEIFDERKIRTEKEKNTILVNLPNDGKTLLTKEIQAILDSSKDGDMIVFPKGKYLTGALFLRDNHDIYLEKGAMILGSSDPKDYLPKIPSRFEGEENLSYASMINIGEMNRNGIPSIHNVRIHGEGEIEGGGGKLTEAIIEEESKHYADIEGASTRVLAGRHRNRLINISNGENIRIYGLRLAQSSSWNVHLIYSSDIYLFNDFFHSYNLHNGDGIDPDSSHDVYIFGNSFDTGDDCVAIKSGKNPEGNIIGIPTYNVSIFDCKAIGTHGGHGCAIGSEISGGISDIDIFNCDFSKTRFGLHIKTTEKRGAYIKRIRANKCQFSAINIHLVRYNNDGEGAADLSEISSICVKNSSITGIDHISMDKIYPCRHILIEGFDGHPEKFSDINLENITLIDNGDQSSGCLVRNATNITMANIIEKR